MGRNRRGTPSGVEHSPTGRGTLRYRPKVIDERLQRGRRDRAIGETLQLSGPYDVLGENEKNLVWTWKHFSGQ